MNFYKHHLGDYAAATSHLSWDEDCAYRRLLDAYYKREAPLPAEVRDVCRLARATTPAQRRAVETILAEFFKLQPDGWHQKRCDEEIGQASAQADTNRRIAEERERKKRERIEHESLTRSSNEPITNRSPATSGEREPSQTPDSTSQTPDSKRPPPPSVVTPGSKPKATKRCPAEFLVTAELQRWAREKAPLVDIRAETATFRDYEFPKAKTDWPATWRVWMAKEQKRLAERRHPNGAVTDVGFGLETLADRAKRERIAEMTGGLASRQPTNPPGPPALGLPESFDAIAHDER